MRRGIGLGRRGRTVLLAGGLVALVGLFVGGTAPSGAATEERHDRRSHEILEFRCTSDISERRITLFGNGTVRVWTTEEGERRVELGELNPEELAGYRRRIRAEPLDDLDSVLGSAEGDWIASCTLSLEPVPGETYRYEFSRRDTLPLAVGRLVSLAEELEDRVRPASGGGFPSDYVPREGDVLERGDGRHYVIIGFTSDRLGVELEALEQPITLYTPRGQLRDEFVGLVRRSE